MGCLWNSLFHKWNYITSLRNLTTRLASWKNPECTCGYCLPSKLPKHNVIYLIHIPFYETSWKVTEFPMSYHSIIYGMLTHFRLYIYIYMYIYICSFHRHPRHHYHHHCCLIVLTSYLLTKCDFKFSFILYLIWYDILRLTCAVIQVHWNVTNHTHLSQLYWISPRHTHPLYQPFAIHQTIVCCISGPEIIH